MPFKNSLIKSFNKEPANIRINKAKSKIIVHMVR